MTGPRSIRRWLDEHWRALQERAAPMPVSVSFEILGSTTARSYLQVASLKYLMPAMHFQDMLQGNYF
jgi:hypothetical protein